MINYGVMSPKVDLRDYRVMAAATDISEFQLTNLPEVKNQGNVGSCAAHAVSSILEWFNKKETRDYNRLSVGFIYGMQGIACDRIQAGMYLRDACKIAQQYGDCLYNTAPFDSEMPMCYHQLLKVLNDDVYKEASISKVESYAKCTTDDDVKYTIMTYGPVAMSIKWYDKCIVDDNGVVKFDTASPCILHGVMVYGFNNKGWLCQNSWGANWGNNGRFILPYDEGFVEAWGFVDAENVDVRKPKRGKWLDILYKVLNSILNFFKSFKKEK